MVSYVLSISSSIFQASEQCFYRYTVGNRFFRVNLLLYKESHISVYCKNHPQMTTLYFAFFSLVRLKDSYLIIPNWVQTSIIYAFIEK